MKKQMLVLMSMFVASVVLASETSQQKEESIGKVFNAGMTTNIHGNNIYSYLHGNGLHRPCLEFKEIRVIEFKGRGEYRDHGTLKELRANFPQSKPIKSPNQMKRIKKDKTIQEQKKAIRRMITDYAGGNEAIYCDGIVTYFNHDDEQKKTGAIILGSQNLNHCKELEKHLQRFIFGMNR